MEMFWLVWSPDGTDPPRIRHQAESLAENAAETMARLHPGQSFFVMRAIAQFAKDDVKKIVLVEPIPF